MSPTVTVGQHVGPKNSRTDPATGLRWYTWRGVEYPSVTTIRRLAGVPHRLAEWQIGQVAARAIERMAEFHGRLSTADPDELVKVRQELRAAAVDKREARAAFGTAVHQAIEARMGLSVVGSDIAPRLRQFLDWRSTSGVELLGSELQVWNPTVGYAGSVDALARFPDGSVRVEDWKSGGDDLDEVVYPDQLLQLLPYVMAEFVGQDDVVDDAMTAHLRTATGVGILHLVDHAWEFRSLEATPAAWRAFRGLLAFARWMADHQSIDDVTLGKKRGAA
jgi:hypothetical protein